MATRFGTLRGQVRSSQASELAFLLAYSQINEAPARRVLGASLIEPSRNFFQEDILRLPQEFFEHGKRSSSHELLLIDLEVCPACRQTKLRNKPCKSAFCRTKPENSPDKVQRTLLERWLHLAS